MAESPPSSQQACVACRNQKRKCDKAIPRCGLCTRTGRDCDYSVRVAPSAANLSAVQARLAELEERLQATVSLSGSSGGFGRDLSSFGSPWSSQQTPFVSANATNTAASYFEQSHSRQQQEASKDGFPLHLFLDQDTFHEDRMQLPSPTVQIPMEVLAILSHENTVVDTSTLFFETISRWMPFISRKRMDMGIPLRKGGPDLAMLFFAMKLLTSPLEPGASPSRSHTYCIAKKYLADLEVNGDVSLLCLQAMILVALYEYGHGIYPAAWMTVGSCARYADMLGIKPGKESTTVLGNWESWTEFEERKRVWWAIFVLDRIIALGNRGRFAAADPPEAASLPADDDAWIKSAGDAMRDMSQPITTPLHVPQSQFARLCQAAILASHCIRTRQDPPPSSPEPIFALADELRRFDAILESEAWHGGPIAAVTDITDRLPAPRYVVVSAMFVLIDPYCYPVPATPEHHQPPQAKTPEQVELQRRAKDTATHVVERAYGSLKEVLEVVGDRAVPSPSEAEQLGACSPFGLDAIYRIMVVYGWLCHETGDGQNKDRMHDMENILGILGVRWGLARVYCRLNKYHDLLQDLD